MKPYKDRKFGYTLTFVIIVVTVNLIVLMWGT